MCVRCSLLGASVALWLGAAWAWACAVQEVADHASGDTCWIVINDNVLDVTKFLLEHPGGEDIIMEHAGAPTCCATRVAS